MSDEELIAIIRNNDKELYAMIVKRYEKKLLRYVIYFIKNKDKAADIVQETFIKAYINLNGFNIKKKFSSWLYRIAHNETINFIKKNKKERPITDSMNLISKQDVEKDLDKKEIIENAQNCLDEMSIIYSEPLALFYLDEKSYEEISDILRIPMGTVATRINRAKLIMKKICEKKK